jgi:hypothetical protein
VLWRNGSNNDSNERRQTFFLATMKTIGCE